MEVFFVFYFLRWSERRRRREEKKEMGPCTLYYYYVYCVSNSQYIYYGTQSKERELKKKNVGIAFHTAWVRGERRIAENQ